jgi:amino acid adenylation domain-containing protein
MSAAGNHLNEHRFGEAIRELTRARPFPPITTGQVGEHAELSYLQEPLWVLSQLQAASIAYNVPVAWKLSGSLDVYALEQSLDHLVRRHESLRTHFPQVDGKFAQRVSSAAPFSLSVIDLTHVPADQMGAETERVIAEELRRPFDLGSGPLFQAFLLCQSGERHILLLKLHHIIADGVSVGTLVSELGALYESFSTRTPATLKPLTIGYRDFAAWERNCLPDESLEKHLAYWQGQLDGVKVLELPGDRRRPPVQSFRGGVHYYKLQRSLTESLVALSRREGVTTFMVVTAAFQSLLHRYTEEDDIVVGFPIANRSRVELYGVVGHFVNTLPLRISFSENPTFRELLKLVREAMLWAYVHRDLPFAKLVEKLAPERNLGSNPFFQVMIDQAQSSWLKLSLKGLEADYLPLDNGTSKFDLSLHCLTDTLELSGWFEYSADLFDPASIQRMVDHFQRFLTAVVNNPDQPVSKIPLLTSAERRTLLVDWQQTRADCPGLCIHQLFEQQAQRKPDSVAVETGNRRLTYRQLDESSNQLAHYLAKLGVGRETLVGVCLNRSPEMITALLGILKAGGAYVPLDPSYPQERLAFLLKDAGIQVLITMEQLAKALPENSATLVCLDQHSGWIEGEDKKNPVVKLEPENLAYVIYTSGSTGQPKGVQATHRGAVNRMAWMWKQYPFAKNEVACAKTSLNFVDSVWEIFGPLLCGVPLVLIPDEVVKDPAQLISTLADRSVSRVVSVPSLLKVVLAAGRDLHSRLPQLKYWISSGETLSLDLIREFKGKLQQATLINLYGSSEVAGDVTCYDTHNDENCDRALIGYPIGNTQVYILDSELEPVPMGFPGELCVGGAGLARGYVNRPEETASKFVRNPFSDEYGGRLYRTGDRGRYRADGNIEFLGRMDQQVKIRGFRVEPAEIEALLRKCPGAKEAAVISKEGTAGDPRLVAYVVPDMAGEETSAQASQADRLSHWKEVWDETYLLDSSRQDTSFNISGWKSSYTGAAIPEGEMREWVDGTVGSILELGPQRVLELGCGSGLLLSRIAPRCTEYVGTDFSAVSLQMVGKQVAAQGLRQVTLLQRGADEFAGFAPSQFDTVILNSVVQYFPNIEYLMLVLKGAVGVTRPGGSIFVGDVRNLRLLEAFHASVELAKAPSHLPLSHLERAIQKRVAEEPELVIDPLFFSALQQHLPSIDRVEVLVKRGVYRNEMNRYRYDVVLHLQPENRNDGECNDQLDWGELDLNLRRLGEMLRGRSRATYIINVPNGRVTMDAKALELIRNPGSLETVGDIRRSLSAQPNQAIDPEDLYRLSSSHSTRVYVSGDKSDCYDVLFQPRQEIVSVNCNKMQTLPTQSRSWLSYANNPLRSTLAYRLIPELRKYLQERVPDYMIPAAFVMLPALPLTPNGKLDRRALPATDASRPQLEQPFVAPQTSVEHTIERVWREVLQIEKVGIHDRFFDLGGHSLLLVVVHNRLVELLKRQISIITLFQYPTIRSLAEHLSEENVEQRPLHSLEERARKRKEALLLRQSAVEARPA